MIINPILYTPKRFDVINYSKQVFPKTSNAAVATQSSVKIRNQRATTEYITRENQLV